MIKTYKVSIAITAILVAALVLTYGFYAYAASSLFGGASFGVGHVVLVSDGSDNPGNTANDFSGISFDDMNGELFSDLGVLSAEFDVTDDSCGAGSPRFQIAIDTDADTVSNGNIFVYMGPSPSFSGCVGGSFITTGNLIGNEDAGRWDYTQLGGPLGGYSGAPASVLDGTIVGISIVIDSYWNAAASGGDSEMTTLIDNVTIKKLVGATYDFDTPPASDVTVTIVKYIDGSVATPVSADNLSFPMESSWSDAGFPDGSGSFDLASPNYMAQTAVMTSGANYNVEEVLTDPNVGASCAEAKPYALVGYSVGDSLGAAELAIVSTSSPSLTNITSDKYIIVWNEECVPPPTTGTLTLLKDVVNDDGGTAQDDDWTLSASGPTPISGVEGDASITSAVVDPGTYDLSESAGPSGYTASAWVCTGAALQDDGDTVTVAAGEDVICTITNDDVAAPPQPVETACDTLIVPDGFTLLNGSAGYDNVTLAPFTMFVGNGGNDVVNATAAGNYIICTEEGHDKITVGSGEAVIDAGGGNNRIDAGDGNKTVFADDGHDRITTGNGNDLISAGNGFNRVESGGGDDNITTGAQNSNINGGDGFDTCVHGGAFDSVDNCEA